MNGLGSLSITVKFYFALDDITNEGTEANEKLPNRKASRIEQGLRYWSTGEPLQDAVAVFFILFSVSSPDSNSATIQTGIP